MCSVGVVPVLVGPLQVLLALLPALLAALGGVLLALFRPSTFKKFFRLLWAQRLAVAIVVVAAVLLLYVLPRLMPNGRGVAAESAAGHEMFRGGPDRRGWSPGADDPTTGGRVWASTKVARTFYSSPAVVGKYVYASSAEKGVFSDRGNILCLDAASGELVWKDGLDGYRATFSSPAVSGDYVVCGEGLHVTTDARVVCLDRRTGKTVWEFRTASHVESSPCIYRGKVYVGAGDDGYYCLALEGDGAGKPKVLWHKPGKDYPDSETPPVAHEGKVYAGLGLEGRAVCCLDAETGQELWRLSTPYPVFAPPTVADGKLYIGMGNGNYVATAEEAWNEVLAELKAKKASDAEIARVQKEMAKGGAVWCIDLATHQKVWSYELPDVVLGAIAAGNGRLYFGCRDGSFHCLSTDGKQVACWNALSPIMTSPALANGHVYFVTSKGVLYGLDAATLEPRWQAQLWSAAPSSTDFFFSSPAVANGHVYVGTPTEGLVCLGKPGKPPAPLWAGYLGGPGQSGRGDQSPLPEKLELAWTYTAKAPDEDLQVTGPLAYLDGALYVPARRNRVPGLAKLKLAGTPAHPPEEAWFVPAPNPISVSPAAEGSLVHVVDGQPGDRGRRLRTLATDDGKERWSWPVADGASGEFVISRDRVFIAGSEKGIACLVRDSKDSTTPVWTYTRGGSVGAPVESDGRVILALTAPDRLVVLDSLGGAELWSVSLPAKPTAGPILVGEAICVGLESGAFAFSLLNGKPLWKQPEAGKVDAPIVAAGGKLACLNANQDITLMDAASGAVVKTFANVAGHFPPLLTPDAIFIYRDRGVIRARTDEQQGSSTWLRASRSEKILTPLIVVNSHAYCATAKGLTCAKPAQ